MAACRYDVHCCIGAVLEPYSADPMIPEQRAALGAAGQGIIDAINAAGRSVTRFVEGGSGVPGKCALPAITCRTSTVMKQFTRDTRVTTFHL